MREKLQPYQDDARLNYLCILATEIMKVDSLKPVLGLLTGFDSILDTLPLLTARAVRNLRLAGVAPRTPRELRLMVDGYRKSYERQERRRRRTAALLPAGKEDAEEVPEEIQEPRFAIDSDLNVRRLWTDILPEDVRQAQTMLTARLEHALQARPPLADPKKKAAISSDKAYYEGTVQPLGFTPPEPPSYNLERLPRAPGFVRWADLIAIAERFDAMDVASGRQQEGQRSWFKRLHDAQGNPTAKLRKAAPDGLTDCDGIELSGMVHLIGLPGAGKTTLLYLLAAYMQDRGHQSCFLFPSIEVSTAFVEKLALYEVNCGLLFGQGETARNKHVLNFSAALSVNNGGFGVTRSVAPFFSTNCALAGFTSDEEEPFPHGTPPCSNLRQASDSGKRDLKKRCALSSVCGRQHSERTLAEATIWVGHALSMDRQVSRLYTDAKIQHFDLIGYTFDLIVVDECDGTQSVLDARGTPIMKIIGDSESLWSNLIRGVHAPAASGSNAFMSSASMPDLLEKTGRFGRSAERLATSVAHLPKQFQQANANLLLTALSLLADMFVPPKPEDEDEDQEAYVRAREGLELLWDTAAKIVAFGQHAEDEASDEDEENDDEVDFDIEKVFEKAAHLMDADVAQVRDFFTQLRDTLASWEASGSDTALLSVAAVLRRTPNLVSSLGSEEFLHYTTLLTNVSSVVIRHFGLAPHLRLLNSQGFVGDEVFESRPSKDQLAILPEALIGRLSGVRYTVSDDGDINVTHVGFAGTPRLLPQRMMQLGADRDGGGPAVLFTSATSLLQQSPSFHIHLRPDYVLQRPNAGEGWKNSKYTFSPKRDPNDDNRPIRFSGAKLSRRDAALKLMVDELLKNASLSDVEVALQSNDVVDGVGRKAGFIVNSYEQCELIYRHIISHHPRWRGRARYLVRASFQGALPQDAVTASEIERLGWDKEWDLLIFPMNAIGRGVNIVYQFGPRVEKAMLGSLYFLTRPHPRGDSLQLIQGIIGRASEEFDGRHFSSLEEALEALRQSRHRTAGVIKHLLRLPLAVQSLGQYAEPFVADLMVIILQTIGRAMRGDCPAFVYFVDAAWAQRSAYGEEDTARTSMLVMMQQILKTCLSHPDQAIRECYENLYQPFYHPLTGIDGLEVKGIA